MEHTVLYFGCYQYAGHYLFDTDFSKSKIVLPWQTFDCCLCPGYVNDYNAGPQKLGLAKLHHKDGWTALAFWDRSGDHRFSSNSVFFINKIVTFDEAITIAKEAFPTIWQRFNFEVKIENENS